MRLVAVFTITLALVGAGSVHAGSYAFGTLVDKADYDYLPVAKGKDVVLCWVDDDGSGTYTAGEPLYLLIGTVCGPVKGKDIRLSGMGDKAPGTEVKGAEMDFAMVTSGPLAHNVVYVDLDGDGEASDGDVYYLTILSAGTGRVGVGDLRLSAYGDEPAGTLVMAGDADLNHGTGNIGDAGPVLLSDPNAVYKAGSAYYVNVDMGALGTSDLGVEDADVRLLNKAANPFEDLVGPAAPTVGAAALEVTELTASLVEGFGGAAVRLVFVVANIGDATGSGLVATRVDGVLVDARGTPTLAPGATATLVLTLPLAAAGGEALAIDVNGATASLALPGPSGGDNGALALSALTSELDSLGAAHESALDRIEALQLRLDALEVARMNADDAPLETASTEDADVVRGSGPLVATLVLLAGLLGGAAYVGRRRGWF